MKQMLALEMLQQRMQDIPLNWGMILQEEEQADLEMDILNGANLTSTST